MNLQLSLKKQWFEMTRDGIKTEDYRELNEYWAKRLIFRYDKVKDCYKITNEEMLHIVLTFSRKTFGFQPFGFKPFDKTILTLGYPSKTDTSRIIQFEHLGIEISTGREEWGAEPGKLYFVIKHGKRL